MLSLSAYRKKFKKAAAEFNFSNLPAGDRKLLQEYACKYFFSYQELHFLYNCLLNLYMWDVPPFWHLLETRQQYIPNPQNKKTVINSIKKYFYQLRANPKYYKGQLPRPPQKKVNYIKKKNNKFWGRCPAYSPNTVCCGLFTIDAVKGCPFHCSYCSIQTFYTQNIEFTANLANGLKNIKLSAHKLYHFGTGQSSDSLVFGNKNNTLSELTEFAAIHPNIILEFKTKSININFFKKQQNLPPNIVISWSLNTDTITENEEHFTPLSTAKIKAAQELAGKGIKIAFHFHPVVFYAGWFAEYKKLCQTVVNSFSPEQIAFISFGTVIFIKPVIKELCKQKLKSKILQMELVPNPDNKLTYPNHVKEELFNAMYSFFAKWHQKVFFYLCMEPENIWRSTFNFSYKNNKIFEEEWCNNVMQKLKQR